MSEGDWKDERVQSWFALLRKSEKVPEGFPMETLEEFLKEYELADVHELGVDDEDFVDFCDSLFVEVKEEDKKRCASFLRERLGEFMAHSEESSDVLVSQGDQERARYGWLCMKALDEKDEKLKEEHFARHGEFEVGRFRVLLGVVEQSNTMYCAIGNNGRAAKTKTCITDEERLSQVLKELMFSAEESLQRVVICGKPEEVSDVTVKLMEVAIKHLVFGVGKVDDKRLFLVMGKGAEEGVIKKEVWMNKDGTLTWSKPKEFGLLAKVFLASDDKKRGEGKQGKKEEKEKVVVQAIVDKAQGVCDWDNGLVSVTGSMLWLLESVEIEGEACVAKFWSSTLVQMEIPSTTWMNMSASHSVRETFKMRMMGHGLNEVRELSFVRMQQGRGSPTQREKHYASVSPEKLLEDALLLCMMLPVDDNYRLCEEATMGELKELARDIVECVPLDTLVHAERCCQRKEERDWVTEEVKKLDRVSECVSEAWKKGGVTTEGVKKHMSALWSKRGNPPYDDFSKDKKLSLVWDYEKLPIFARCLEVFLDFPAALRPEGGWTALMGTWERVGSVLKQIAFWTKEWKMSYHMEARERKKEADSTKNYVDKMKKLLELLDCAPDWSLYPVEWWSALMEEMVEKLEQEMDFDLATHPLGAGVREALSAESVEQLQLWLKMSGKIGRLRKMMGSIVIIGIVGQSKMGKSNVVETVFGMKSDYDKGKTATKTLQCVRFGKFHVLNTPGCDDNDTEVKQMTWRALPMLTLAVVVMKYDATLKEGTKSLMLELSKNHKEMVVLITHIDEWEAGAVSTGGDKSKKEALSGTPAREAFLCTVRTREKVNAFDDTTHTDKVLTLVKEGMLLAQHIRGILVKRLLELGLSEKDVVEGWKIQPSALEKCLDDQAIEWTAETKTAVQDLMRERKGGIGGGIGQGGEEGEERKQVLLDPGREFSAEAMWKRGKKSLLWNRYHAACYWMFRSYAMGNQKAKAAVVALLDWKRKEAEQVAKFMDEPVEKLQELSKSGIDPKGLLEQKSKRVIGKGGFGVVYECKHGNKKVAVKTLSIELGKKDAHDCKSALWTELLVLRMLPESHKNVIELLGFSYEPAALVMELAEYGSLSEFCRFSKEEVIPLKEELCLELCRDTAAGLLYLHEHDIVHRDLKGENVLLCDGLVAKVADFGLTRVSVKTMSTTAVGTCTHLAAESLKGNFSKKSDVYALAVTFWELFSRSRAYQGKENAMQVFAAIQKGQKPGDIKHFPEAMREMMTKCWATKDERPTVAEVLEALKMLLLQGQDTTKTREIWMKKLKK